MCLRLYTYAGITFQQQLGLPSMAMQFSNVTMLIQNSVFQGLTSKSLAALAFSGSSVTLKNCSFINNNNSAGAAAVLLPPPQFVVMFQAVLTRCALASLAGAAAGGLYANSSSAIAIQDSYFAGNQGALPAPPPPPILHSSSWLGEGCSLAFLLDTGSPAALVDAPDSPGLLQVAKGELLRWSIQP